MGALNCWGKCCCFRRGAQLFMQNMLISSQSLCVSQTFSGRLGSPSRTLPSILSFPSHGFSLKLSSALFYGTNSCPWSTTTTTIWYLSGIYLVSIWYLSGIYLVSIWYLPWIYLVSIWYLSGISLEYIWYLSGIYLVSIWYLVDTSRYKVDQG